MKQFLMFFLLIATIVSCSTEAVEPKFKKVKNIKVVELTKDKVTINGDAIIYNPNPASINMSQVKIDVFANDTKVGQVDQTKMTTIAKKADFSLPLSVSFKPKDLFKDNLLDLLSAGLSALQDKKVNLLYKGHATFEVKGISFKVPIEYEDEVELKKEN